MEAQETSLPRPQFSSLDRKKLQSSVLAHLYGSQLNTSAALLTFPFNGPILVTGVLVTRNYKDGLRRLRGSKIKWTTQQL